MTIPHGVDEPGESYLSRLAARNGVDLSTDFCRDVELRFQDVVDGDPNELRRLATMAGVDPAALVAASFAREENQSYVVGGHRIPLRWMGRGTTRVCPACLLEDAANSDLPPEIAMHARFWWGTLLVGACPLHDVPLVSIASGRRPTIHDIVADLRGMPDPLPALLASLTPRRATRPERYLVGRLSGRHRDGAVPFLDGLPAFVGARFCDVIGAIRVHGKNTLPKTLDEADRLAAGEAGFDIVAGGADAVRAFVVNMIKDRPGDRSYNGSAKFVLGGLDAWLYQNKGNPDLMGLRRFLSDIAIEHLPLGPGETCLGLPVGRRVLHSVCTASKESGVHRVRLRKALVQYGFLAERQPRAPDHFMTFPAKAAAPFLASLAGTMDLGDVRSHIGAPRVHGQLLVQGGFLKPINLRDARGKGMLAFMREHVDSFLADLTRDARDVEDPTAYTIIDAAKRVPCGAMDIVRLLVERRLPFVGRSRDADGYLSVLVRPDDVRNILVPEGPTLTVRGFAEAAGIPIHRVRHLIYDGSLRSTLVRRNEGGRTVHAIPRTELARLETNLIGLSELAAAWGFKKEKAAYILRRCGILVVRSPIESQRRHYRMADIASNVGLRTRQLFLPQ
nr:TniQ family protein [Methylobacterium sp. BTF04]